MVNKDKKFKEIEDSRVLTKRRVGQEVSQDGRTMVYTRWQIEETPLELGSAKNPKNTDIMEIKIEVPDYDNSPMGKFFNKFMK